jgi:hypothetical protein
MIVWKAIDAKTRMSPFMAKKRPSFAVRFNLGEKVEVPGARLYACKTLKSCLDWINFAERKFCITDLVVIKAEGEDPIVDPPMMHLVRMTKIPEQTLPLAWETTEKIIEFLKANPNPTMIQQKEIAKELSTPYLSVVPDCIRNGPSRNTVACKSLICLEEPVHPEIALKHFQNGRV